MRWLINIMKLGQIIFVKIADLNLLTAFLVLKESISV